MNLALKVALAAGLLGIGITMGRLSKESSPISQVEPLRTLVTTKLGATAEVVHREDGLRMREAADTVGEEAAALLAEMDQAEGNYDHPQLDVFERGLKHADPSVRQAACEALVRLSSSDGAPLLHAAAERATDHAEGVRFEEAAKFLEMPEVSTELNLKSDKTAVMTAQPKPRRMKITPAEEAK